VQKNLNIGVAQENSAQKSDWDKNDQHSKIYLPCNFEVNQKRGG
jgi:hypothetical protein